MRAKLDPRLDGWNVVVLGHFDPLILTPRWVSEHVADSEVNVELPSHARLPPRLRFSGVSILVVEGRLIVAPDEAAAKGLASAEKVTSEILTLLPHTPVNGVGVNFQWRAPREGALAAVLTCSDDDGVKTAGFRVESAVVRRRLVGKGRVVNLTVESEGDEARVSVNFHVDAASAQEAKAAIGGRTAPLLVEAEQLLARLYG